MVVPFDDHMVHRGHSVFDTAHVCDGRCHLLDRHLARFERSMRSAKLNPPAGQSLASMRATILATIAASGLRDAQVYAERAVQCLDSCVGSAQALNHLKIDDYALVSPLSNAYFIRDEAKKAKSLNIRVAPS